MLTPYGIMKLDWRSVTSTLRELHNLLEDSDNPKRKYGLQICEDNKDTAEDVEIDNLLGSV
jgi:hypothetical protein